MSLLSKIWGKNKPRRIEIKEAPSSKNALQKFAVKAVSMIKGDSGGDDRETPDVDLNEIKIAHETDSYMKIAFMKYSYMLFKAGYKIKSPNEKASDYVKLRLYIMSFSTNKPIDILFQEIGDDIIKYSNAFLVKSRVKQIMNGVQAKGFLSNQPVGGYFRVDPSTISIERDANGTIKKYVQEVDGKDKSFNPTEVIHFYMDKDAGAAFGKPRTQAALEDVKLLRRIEGNVVAMIYRYSMPLYQWIIGLAQNGYQATNKEIDEAREEIEKMTFDGTVVTNEKTQIKVIGAEGNALDVSSYLKYYEERVFTALNVSSSQMGRAGGKQDADAMESQAHDTIKYIQRIFSIFVENFIINELLFEGGFDPINKVEDRTTMEFNEISIETKIKVENHEMSKYQSNMITFEEVRREIGKPEEADETSLYKNKIEVNAEKQIAAIRSEESIKVAQESAKLNQSQQAAGTGGGNGLSPKGNGNTKDQKPNKDVSNKNTPANQHGKTSVKVKENVDVTESVKSRDKKYFNSAFKEYNSLKNKVINDIESYDNESEKSIDTMLNIFKSDFNEAIVKGANDCLKDYNEEFDTKSTVLSSSTTISEIDKNTRKDLVKLFKDIKSKIGNSEDQREIVAVFEAMEYRLRFILNYSVPQSYWLSYCNTAKSFGLKYIYIDFDGSKDEEKHKRKVSLNKVTIKDIPPFHPYCDCKIKLKEV